MQCGSKQRHPRAALLRRRSDISFNLLRGALPAAVCDWARVVPRGPKPLPCTVLDVSVGCQSTLHASSNAFISALPACLLEAPGLELIDVSSNFFFGCLPAFGGSTALTYLDVSFNNLIGTVPSSIAYTSMAILDLKQNFLNGSIPGGAAAALNLTLLDYSANCDVGWQSAYTGPGGRGESCAATAVVCVAAPQRPRSRCAVVPPAAPSDVRPAVRPGNTSVLVSWAPPALQHAPYAPIAAYVVSVVATDAPRGPQQLRQTVAAAGDTSGASTVISGLTLGVWYTVSVAAVNAAGAGAESLGADLYIPALPFAFSVTEAVVIGAAQVVLYAAAAAASTRWRGDVPACPREFRGALALPFAAVHVGTDLLFGRQLLLSAAAAAYSGVFFGVWAVATAWSARRVYVLLRTATAYTGPPRAPHTLTFAAWIATRRAWVSAVSALAALQLSALAVLTCRAMGRVDGAMCAPLEPRPLRALRAHATAISLVRNGAALIVALCGAGGPLLSPAVFLKVATSGTACLLAIATLSVDALEALAWRRARAAAGAPGGSPPHSELTMKLLGAEVCCVWARGGGGMRARMDCNLCCCAAAGRWCSSRACHRARRGPYGPPRAAARCL